MKHEQNTALSQEDMKESILDLYNRMTPENKEKAIAKYYELLAEQEKEA